MQKINVNILQKPKTIQTSVKNITPINPAKGTKTILQNGIHNIKEFEFISVNVKPDKLQEKEIEIVSNGKYEVTPDDEYFLTKVKVDVNVPIPDGYIIPEGTLEIKDNGTFDVRQFEYVLINVPIPEEYIVPEGKINITNTEEIDVTQYEKAQVVDENLKAENIVNGVEVLGIRGKYVGEGVKINGDIESIEALENISAGDFVEFVNNKSKQLINSSYSCYKDPYCILLERNKIFIAHAYNSSSYLYGTIVNIEEDGSMTVTTTKLNDTSNSCYNSPSCVLLGENKVFIVHTYSSSKYLYGTIVEIDGTNMTPTTTQLTSFSVDYQQHCILLEPNKVFISHSDSSNRCLYGTIVEIDGTNMTPTTTQLNNNNLSCNSVPWSILLESNKIFITHSYSNSYYLYGTIVEIDKTNMTVLSTTQLTSGYKNASYNLHSILLEPNKIFVAYSDSGNNAKCSIVEINEPTITKSDEIRFATSTSASCVLLEPNKVFVTYKSSDKLHAAMVEVNGTSMISTIVLVNDEYSSSYKGPNCVLLGENKVFIAHGYTSSKYLYGTLYFGNKAISTSTTISGVAKTSGNAGEEIQVYIPKEAN